MSKSIFDDIISASELLSVPPEVTEKMIKYQNNCKYLDKCLDAGNCTEKRCYAGGYIANKRCSPSEVNTMFHNHSSNTFNIQNVTNSAFGNTGNVVINNGASFNDIRSLIQEQNIPDPDIQKLETLISLVETTIENDIPMKKGFLHKFGDLFSKYGEICSKIVANILPYFLNQ